MTVSNTSNAPETGFPFLEIPARPKKPRDTWVTIMAERGLPPQYQRDFLTMNASVIDYAKMTDHPNNMAGHSRNLLETKINTYKEFGVKVYLGGMYFEVAHMQGKVPQLLDRAVQLGYTAVELSESTLKQPAPKSVRDDFIKRSQDKGLEIFTEVGRKFPGDKIDSRNVIELIQQDIELGVTGVIIECDEVLHLMRGEPTFLTELLRHVNHAKLNFEVSPTEGNCIEAAAWVIERFGRDANMGNVGDQHVVIIDAMRRHMAPENKYPYLKGPAKKA